MPQPFKLPVTQRTPLDVARSYIAAGVPIFPCREAASEGVDYATGEIMEFAEKAPYTTFGLKDATRSSRIIDIWFNERHPTAVIGIPTGEKLGGWVLDLDRHGDRDGHKWLTEQETIHGPLPDTARASTANGGTHIFFKHVVGVRNRAAIAPGVDTRGDGGYIVGPGSAMADGRRYEWTNHDGEAMPEFADAPAWLIDLVITKAAPAVEAKPREYTYQPEDTGAARYAARAMDMELDKLSVSPKGQRGQQLFSSACSIGELVAAGYLSRSEAEAGLFDAAQANGLVATDGDRKCMDKIKRGLDKTANSPRQIPERAHDNDNGSDPAAVEAFVARANAKKAAKTAAGGAADPVVVSETASTTQPQPKKRERFELTWFDEIEEGKPKETILKGWLGVGEFTTISGLPGTGKSVIVTDIACHIAAGMDWHGKKVRQGLVVYVAAERKKLTERRMMAFRQHHDVHDVPLLVVGGRLDFTKDLKDARDLIAAIREAETITGLPCVWVIIDTLTRVFGGGDQNASKDMTRFVQSCDEILTETKAHVTAIHHSAWSGERGKGAIDLDGAVDASFMVKKDGAKHRLVCDGTNDGEDGDVLAFTMKSVQIGVDEDGEPTTAPVVVPSEAEKPPSSGTLKGFKGDVLAALRKAIDKNGIEPEGDAFPDDIFVVDEQTWRTEFYASRDTSTTGAAETARKQFQRAPRALIDDGHVNNIGIWYWAA
ncbi:AAA family ATPase [Agrobacterium rhizogenes]|uniref:AAA family ATPase n=1 Tax=Rhizobium rhizogenes TaxID=359 RepID=UPI0015716538|nr:AAA family ATPase [Rhizobium rhizogenes]NTG85847.1 AAA family ATPase [Rhizobium rhizogenes]